MSDFFEEVDGLGVSELHIRRLSRLEEDEADKVAEVYRRVIAELKRRLLIAYRDGREDRFTAQRLRGTLMQVEEGLQVLEGRFLEQMLRSGREASELSIEDLLTETQKYEEHFTGMALPADLAGRLKSEIGRYEEDFTGAVTPINLDALTYANQTENMIAEKYEVSLRNWKRNGLDRVYASLQEAIAMEATTGETISKMVGNFEAQEWQIRRIVRTELHGVYNGSKIRGMGDLQRSRIPDLMKALLHPLDKRTADDSKYLAGLNPILPIEEPFRYVYKPSGSSKEYYREFMAPPDRPNDRAILIPFRPAWADDQGIMGPTKFIRQG